MGEPERSVQSLLRALRDAEPHTFTPLHYHLAYQALRTRSYAEALPVLDNDIYKVFNDHSNTANGSSPTQPMFASFMNESSALRYQEVVSYFLYGGMIYMAIGNYDRAIRFLELATIYPANNTASRIQVEAYKKWILVNLLHKGKVPPLVRPLVGQHSRIIQALAKPYEAVAEAFKQGEFRKLAETVDIGRSIWAQDLNTGLISLVLRAHQRFAISSLAKVYQSISISQVHDLAFPASTTHDEVYQYVSALIVAGDLSATLTPPVDSIVSGAFLRFVTNSGEGAEVETQREQTALQQQARIEAVNEYVKDMTHTLQLTRPYLEALSKSKKKATNQADGTTNGSANVGSLPGHFDIEDEDEYLETL